MQSIRASHFVLGVAGLVLPAFAHAQYLAFPASGRVSFSPVGSGARGMGMGGAFIAVADDGTAATFNPAGLANLRQTELALVVLRSSIETKLGGPLAAPDRFRSTDQSRVAPDFTGIAVPFDVGSRNLTLQLSYQRVADFDGGGSTLDVFRKADESSPTGETDYSYLNRSSQSGAFQTISFAGGYELTDSLSLGGAVSYWIGSWEVSGSADLLGGPTGRPKDATYLASVATRTEQSLRGINGTVGFLLQRSWLRIGGVFRTSLNASYRLSERDSGTVWYDASGPQPYEFAADIKTRFRWPRSAGIGIAAKPLTGLTVTAEFTRTHWSDATVENVPGGAFLKPRTDPVQYRDLNYFDLLPASETLTPDNTTWRAGAEYLLTLSSFVIPIRAGHYRDRSPLQDQYTRTGRPIKGWTLGTGLNLQSLALDVAGEWRKGSGIIGWIFDSEGTPLQIPATEIPTEELQITRVLVSVIYRFDRGDDPIKRTFRRIFAGND